MGKRVVQFLRGDGGEPGPVDRHGLVCLPHQFVRFLSNQFPLGIKVRCNGDAVCLFGEFLEEGDDPLLGRHLDGLCIDEASWGILLAAPVGVAGFEIDLDHVAPEPHGCRVPKRVRGDTGILVLDNLLPVTQNLGNTPGRDVLFRNDQVHGCYTSRFFSASMRRRLSSPGSAFPRVFFMTCPTRKLSALLPPFR